MIFYRRIVWIRPDPQPGFIYIYLVNYKVEVAHWNTVQMLYYNENPIDLVGCKKKIYILYKLNDFPGIQNM